MKISLYKTWMLGIFCLIFTFDIYASKISGYIIDNNSDTLYGIFRIRNISQTGALLINGFDKESLHLAIHFKKNDETSFKTILPGAIKEFYFSMDSVEYCYRSFLIQYNSLSYNDKNRQRFLRLLHEGELDLYEDIVITEKTNGSFAGERTHYYEYFIGQNHHTITRIKIDDKTPNLKAVLSQFLMNDDDFLNRISEMATIKDLPVILREYDLWLQSE
jgi:hypothetical protein